MELFLCVKTSGRKSSETEKEKEKEGGAKEGVSGRHKASLQLLVTLGGLFRDSAFLEVTQLSFVSRPLQPPVFHRCQ